MVSGVKSLMQLKCFELMEIQPARPACAGFSYSESGGFWQRRCRGRSHERYLQNGLCGKENRNGIPSGTKASCDWIALALLIWDRIGWALETQ